MFRAFSTFVLPGAFGMNMAFISLIAITMLLGKDKTLWSRIGFGIGISIMILGLFLSGSRGPLVMLAIGIFTFIFFLKGISKQVVVVSVCFVSLLAVSYLAGNHIFERYRTIVEPREFFWKWYNPLKAGVGIALSNPIGEGMGYTAGVPKFLYSGNLREDLGTRNIDSGIGSAAAELGIPGLLIFLYLVAQLLRGSLAISNSRFALTFLYDLCRKALSEPISCPLNCV